MNLRKYLDDMGAKRVASRLASSDRFVRSLALWDETSVIHQHTIDEYVAGLLDEPEIERLMLRAEVDQGLRERIEEARARYEAPIPSDVASRIEAHIQSLNAPRGAPRGDAIVKVKPRSSPLGLVGPTLVGARDIDPEENKKENEERESDGH